MHDLNTHLRFAIRQLRRNPGFALTAIVTLAIGIGATTAIFSIFTECCCDRFPTWSRTGWRRLRHW